MEEQRYREDMELVLAKQFGFEDYDSFREGLVKTIGKTGLKKLEKELDKFPQRAGAEAADTMEAGATPPETRPM